jgi:methylglutaconyl-CoA hydratase
LVDRVVDSAAENLAQTVREELNLILSAGPYAQKQLKMLVNELRTQLLEQGDYTAHAIANARRGEQGQKGLDAFFAKEKAPWCQELPANWQYDATTVGV